MDFKKLKAKDKLEYILRLQSEGLDPQQISDNMGYSRLKNLNEFMKKQGYENQDNRYIRQVEDICPTSEMAITVEDSCHTVSLQDQHKLIDIIDNHNKIMDMLKWFENMEDTCPTEVIEVVSGLQINYIKSNTVKTTIRIDDDVWTTFSDICKDKYGQFSKVDILSQILHEFNEKNIK